MAWKIRLGVCGAMSLFALSMAAYAVMRPVQATAAAPTAQEAINLTAAAVVSRETAKPGFLLRNCGGYIGNFRSENPDLLIELTAIELATLRQVDRDMLDQGIYCRTERELYSLLEDFGS